MKDVAEIIASSTYGEYVPANLVDESMSTKWWSTTSGPIWVKVRLTSPKRFVSYEMVSSDNTGDAPKSWVLEGSNDDNTWTALHTIIDQSWGVGEKRTFNFTNSQQYLYYRLNNLYAQRSNNWVQFAELNLIEGVFKLPTVDEFKQHGMTDLSVIPESAWNQLESANIKILVLTKDTSINSASVNVTAIPKRQLIMQETDMIFEKPIKSFTLTGTVQNESVLKIIASNDSGTTWKAFNGVSWHPVDISDLDDVKSNGMDIATFNNVRQEAWKPFLSGMKLRLAYYLDLHAVTDTLLIDKLAYETVPVVSNSPKLHSIKIETNSLTIEGRLKELERINAINMAKLNFKSNALLKSEKYKMHDMVIDTCESDSMKIIASSGAGETKQEVAFSNTVELGSGKVSELSIASIANIKKVEVK